MTKKDFELIARAIRNTRSTCAGDGCTASGALDVVAESLAAELVMTNPRFDASRFIRATYA